MNEDIISVLNKLCRRKVTAAKAISLLYTLSVTENGFQEDAKTSIRNKFFTHLSNNALNFQKRIELLEELRGEFGITESLIHIYGSMLKTDRFYGSIHGESESENYQDFDILDSKKKTQYYNYALEGLSEAVKTEEQNLLKLVEEKLNERLSEQYRFGNPELVLEIVEQLSKKVDKLPIKLRSNIDALILSRPQLSEGKITELKAFLEKFDVETVKDELETVVIEAPYLTERNDTGGYFDISKKRAQDLAEKYIEDKVDWETFLPILLINEQKQTFHFAEKIGQIDCQHEALLVKALDFLKTTDEKEQNFLLVNGLVRGVNKDEFTRKAIELSLNHKNTIGIGVHLTRFLKPIELDDLNKIKPFLVQRPNYLRLLEYIDILHFTNEELIELTCWLKDINLSFSLEILDRVLRKEPERWKSLEKLINPLIFQNKILYASNFINSSLHVESLIQLSINYNPNQENITFILNEIFECYEDFNYRNESSLNSLVYFFLDNYWDISWPLIGQYIIEKEYISHELSHLLSSISFDGSKLLKWVAENPGKREVVAMRCINIFKKDKTENEKLAFETEVLELIDNYGNNLKMLDRLESSLINYTIHSNSAEKLYSERKDLIQTLSEHPIEEVRAFSSRMSARFDSLIEEERNFETNHNIGY